VLVTSHYEEDKIIQSCLEHGIKQIPKNICALVPIEMASPKEYYDAVVLDEVIRKQTNLSIDEIRSDANKYVDFQIDVISQKIDQEAEAIQKYDSKIILVDRTLVDSLMYYLLYVDKNQLSEESLKKYSDFYHHLESAVTYSLNEVYDKIVFMFPQKPNLEDKYRTKKLAYFQKIESDTIYNLTNQYLNNLNNLILLAGDKFNFNDFFIEMKNKGHFCEGDIGREFPELLELILK
jgi:hypothetical protein